MLKMGLICEKTRKNPKRDNYVFSSGPGTQYIYLIKAGSIPVCLSVLSLSKTLPYFYGFSVGVKKTDRKRRVFDLAGLRFNGALSDISLSRATLFSAAGGSAVKAIRGGVVRESDGVPRCGKDIDRRGWFDECICYSRRKICVFRVCVLFLRIGEA
ncbi:MAG: hypothetical protein K2Q19_12980 [Rhodocyclaceae bacterium]|nr:hypothetical protein [Rhodocyclaceae bacterium]